MKKRRLTLMIILSLLITLAIPMNLAFADEEVIIVLRPLKPVLEFVENNGDGTFTAHWGYLNENDFEVDALRSDFNRTPLDNSSPPSEDFQPGRHYDVFQVIFNGDNLVWTLKGPDGSQRTSTASSGSQGPTSAIKVVKRLENEEGKPHAGVRFILYLLGDEGMEQVAEGRTDTNGLLIFPSLYPGSYRLYEALSSNYSSTLNTNNRDMTVDNGQTKIVTIINTLKRGNIHIIKTIGSEEGEPQEGVIFEVFNSGYKETSFTNQEGIAIFSSLEPGEYTIKEIVPEGYISSLEEDYTVEVNPLKTVTVYVVNTSEEEPPVEEPPVEEPPVEEPPTEEPPVEEPPTEEPPDLPDTGGLVEAEIAIAGLGALSAALGIVIKRRRK